MAAWLFWGSVLLCVHAYGGYLLTLVAWDAWVRLGRDVRTLAGRPVVGHAQAELPTVSIVVAAHDEEACIGEKVRGSLSQDYPAGLLEVIVGDDGSTDATAARAREAGGARVQVWTAARSGKAGVLGRVVPRAAGEIVVLTDANTQLEPDCVRALVRRFADPRVGAVCGHLRLRGTGDAAADEGVYWRLESLLKLYEGRRGVVVGANGGVYAVRRSLFRPLPPGTVVDDFVIPMRVLAQGFRVEFAPDAVAWEETAGSAAREFRRRARIAAGNFRALVALRRALVQWRCGLAYAFWSHKVLRWWAPAFMLAALLSSAWLARASALYGAALTAQCTFYALAAVGVHAPGRLGRVGSLSRYFVEMNAALAVGFWRFVRGSQPVAWQRTQREAATLPAGRTEP